jgi:hypothetical protein
VTPWILGLLVHQSSVESNRRTASITVDIDAPFPFLEPMFKS